MKRLGLIYNIFNEIEKWHVRCQTGGGAYAEVVVKKDEKPPSIKIKPRK